MNLRGYIHTTDAGQGLPHCSKAKAILACVMTPVYFGGEADRRDMSAVQH